MDALAGISVSAWDACADVRHYLALQAMRALLAWRALRRAQQEGGVIEPQSFTFGSAALSRCVATTRARVARHMTLSRSRMSLHDLRDT